MTSINKFFLRIIIIIICRQRVIKIIITIFNNTYSIKYNLQLNKNLNNNNSNSNGQVIFNHRLLLKYKRIIITQITLKGEISMISLIKHNN